MSIPASPRRLAAVLVLALLAALPVPALRAEPALAAPTGVSLAGVHFYSGDINLIDQSVPAGQRGWNVEHIPNVSGCDGSVRGYAQTAKNHGLVNIIRMDYAHPLAVPVIPAEYESWKNSFRNCVSLFGDIASIYIVGNEPKLDCGSTCPITAAQYSDAFNYLFARKGEMRAGTELLAVGNAPFNPPIWMYNMSSRLSGTDGFAFHTGGAGGSRPGCIDPRQPCTWTSDNRYDGAFRFYRDVINQIDQRFWNKPVYLSEFNTFTGDFNTEPANNYPADWVNKAYEEIRHYNANRNGRPEIKALVWFVDAERAGSGGAWWNWALTNPDPQTQQARADMAEEFRRAVNRNPGTGVNPHLDAFVRGTDNQIWHRWRTTGAWSGWEQLPLLSGGAGSDPSAVAWGGPLATGGAGRIDVFVRCGTALCHTWFDGQWRAWENWGSPPGVSLTRAPDAASWSWGNLEVFATGSNNKIYQIRYSLAAGRSGWGQPFTDGTANSSVSAVSWGSGRLDLFVRGADNRLYMRSFIQDEDGPAGGWGGWQIGTGTLTTGPDAASWGPGHIDVFVATTGSAPQRLNWNRGTYVWEPPLDGSFTSDPGAAAPARNQVYLFARGVGNNALWYKPWTSGWGAWTPLDGVLTSGPDAASWSLH